MEPPAEETSADGLGFLNESSKSQGRNGPRRAAAVAEPAPAEADDEADDGEDGLATISRLAAKAKASSHSAVSAKAGHLHHAKKKKKSFPGWLIPTIAGVGVAVLVGVAAIIYMSQNKGAGSITAGPSAPADGKAANKADKGPKCPVLTIDWPESDRAGGLIFVDDEKHEVPATGPIELKLPPKTGQYHFSLQRNGFEAQTFNLAVLEDDHHTVRAWVPKQVDYVDWPQQDFDAAKQAAASEHKNVFILFDASDAKESAFASSRFRESIAMSKDFRDRAAKEYVCVYIDNPQKAEAQGRVKDSDRNDALTKKFHITIFPTIVVTDPKGRPYGVLEDYKVNGVNAFLGLMDHWKSDSKHFFDLFDRFAAAQTADPELAGELLDFLEMSKLSRFYAKTIKKANSVAGGENGRPVTKQAAELWMQRFQMAALNPDQARQIVDEFDRWKKTRSFKDPDVGAKLHLVAAVVLWRLGYRPGTEKADSELIKAALQKCKEGLDFHPHDAHTKSALDRLSQYLNHEPGKPFLMPVASGSGYCIAQGNYVLTNHHVIRGAKVIRIHLNDEEERYPAKIVGDDEAHDMALLKVELPAAKNLAPIPLAPKSPKIGEEVCVMGWPGDLSENAGLTFTRGVVSTMVGPNDEDRMIATDCKATHGDSGGPLCSAAGVVGMITAGTSDSATAYGLAIPVDRLRKFVLEKLPADARKGIAPPAAAGLRLADQADIFQHSVVYVENVQEINDRTGQPQESEK